MASNGGKSRQVDLTGESCEKCGGAEIRTHYHAQGCPDPDHGDWCNNCPWGSHNKCHEEHLHRLCQTCHYDWTRPVLARQENVVA